MDKVEAQNLLDEWTQSVRGRSFYELKKLLGIQEIHNVKGPSGAEYNIELQAFWDDPHKRANIRIIISLSGDSFWSSIKPMTMDFIKAPDGGFIGEER